MVTRIFPSPSKTGETGFVSFLLVDDVEDRLRKKLKRVFFFFGSSGAFFSGRTSVQVLPLWNRGIARGMLFQWNLLLRSL